MALDKENLFSIPFPAIDYENEYTARGTVTYAHCQACGEPLDNIEDNWCRSCDSYDHGGMDDI
jgi:hypothetical protein